jgi:hypothetical protein
LVKLIRTQQGKFELGKNVVEWDDLNAEDTTRWEAQVLGALGAEIEGGKDSAEEIQPEDLNGAIEKEASGGEI